MLTEIKESYDSRISQMKELGSGREEDIAVRDLQIAN